MPGVLGRCQSCLRRLRIHDPAVVKKGGIDMGPSDKAFNQVKNILGKLDRNIDDVRNKRLHPEPAAVVPSTRTEPGQMPAATSTTLIGVPKQAPTTAPAATTNTATQARSTFGRARPILPDTPGNSALWKTT